MTDNLEFQAQGALEWPYPVNYGKENEVNTDILVIGGGVAGCHAAINAAKKGATVAVVDKAPIIRSGSGGAGVDHWGGALTNPRSKTTPEEAMKAGGGGPFSSGGYSLGHLRYITSKESYEALLDVEKMGVKIRDEDDEFKGAPFRDEETKLMFAYNYDNPNCIRVQGATIKPAMYKELKRLGIETCDHIMITSLLNEGGKQGGRIIGATGVHIRTGEFYIFKAKATVLSTAQPLRIWIFNTELVGSNVEHDDPNLAGDGDAIGWLAGAELTMMERSMESSGPFRYPAYGTGNSSNTWYPCSIVDANGKEIPWVDGKGNVLKTVEDRIKAGGGMGPGGARLIPDLSERIMKGEFEQPFYADLPSMPEHERRAIFGLMVAHEGKTRIPVYENYTKAGFDPDKDMLQANVLPPQLMGRPGPWWDMKSSLASAPQWRATAFIGGGGLLVDWELKTTLEGMYAAGAQTAGGGGHAPAAATGRFAGRNAAAYAKSADEPVIARQQVDKEKARVYAPVGRQGDIGWKELQAGICRIMQDYCGEYKSEETLKMGLWWLDSIKEGEASRTYVRNPRELVRFLECMVRMTVGEIIMNASLARRASSKHLNFKRLDYPRMDPPEWEKFVTIRQENGEIKEGELPFDFWLKPPYAPAYEENYKRYSRL
ncbi:MAG: FAD-binding protein [Deltaproteobacteria bacterium]|nr:FAD-binding protein [Deltaproteobacteria bacterium]